MSSTKASPSPFHLPQDRQLQSTFFRLPFELKCKVYSKLSDRRTYHFRGKRVYTGDKIPLPGSGIINLLHTCQQIYIETQSFLFCVATLVLEERSFMYRATTSPKRCRAWKILLKRLCGVLQAGVIGIGAEGDGEED